MFHTVRSARLSVLVVGLALLVSMWSPLRAEAASSLGTGPAQSGYTPAPYPSGWTKADCRDPGPGVLRPRRRVVQHQRDPR